MEDCRLCNISKELLIYETTHCKVLANFLQVESVFAIMVIPKRHVETVLNLSQEEYIELCITAREVHRKLVAETGETEFNYLLNEGTQISGKTETHVHLHVFSRKLDDGIVNMSRPNRRKYVESELTLLKQILIEGKSLWLIGCRLFVYIKKDSHLISLIKEGEPFRVEDFLSINPQSSRSNAGLALYPQLNLRTLSRSQSTNLFQ